MSAPLSQRGWFAPPRLYGLLCLNAHETPLLFLLTPHPDPPRDIYMRVQEELVRRRIVKTSANGKKRSYSCNHCFSQIVVCGECGELFRRIHWNNRGCKSIVWRCISRLEPTGQECHARTVNETILENVVLAAINELLGDKPGYQEQLQQNIAVAIRSASTGTEDIDEKLMALQQELLQKANSV